MGLSNYHRYTFTDHAKKRFLERINSTVGPEEMMTQFRRLAAGADYLALEHHGKESWINKEFNVVFIVAPSTFKVVTVYKTEGYAERNKRLGEDDNVVGDSYKEPRKETDKEAEVSSTHTHPKVLELLSESAKEHHQLQKKEYFSQLAPLYAEYADRMDKLSRTKKPTVFKVKEEELNELQATIKKLAREQTEVLEGLSRYFVD